MDQLVLLIPAVLGVLIVGSALYWFSRDARAQREQIERDFRNVFMTTSTEGKEALIKRWMDRKKCSRPEAMRLAVEEWRRENR